MASLLKGNSNLADAVCFSDWKKRWWVRICWWRNENKWEKSSSADW